jgi:hypothetical protein
MPFVVDEAVGYGSSAKYCLVLDDAPLYLVESCDYVILQAFLEQLNVVDNEDEIVASSLPLMCVGCRAGVTFLDKKLAGAPGEEGDQSYSYSTITWIPGRPKLGNIVFSIHYNHAEVSLGRSHTR